MPKVTVVLAVHNGERYLDRSVRSILDQSFGDFEMVIVDDGSTDGTPAILEKWAGLDARITVVRQMKAGLSASLNRGIAMANGDYIARQDADDVSLSERFEEQVAYLDSHPSVAALGAAADVIDESDAVVGRLQVHCRADDVQRGLRTFRRTPVHGSMLMRRRALAETGGYRDAFRACQDYDLWLRLSESRQIENLPAVLYRWRVGRDSVYGVKRAMQLMYAGIAQAFARERAEQGSDSYALLEQCQGELDRFAVDYRLNGLLYQLWGELLFRGLGNSSAVRRYFRRAVVAGRRDLRTLGLLVWTHLRLPWPGGKPLALTTSPQG